MEPIEAFLDDALARIGLHRQAQAWKVARDWRKIVGDPIAKISQPRFAKNGVLYVAASSSAWAGELGFLKAEILGRIKAHVGETSIRDIRFQSSSWEKNDSKTIEQEAAKLAPKERATIERLCEMIDSETVKKAFKGILVRDRIHAQESKKRHVSG